MLESGRLRLIYQPSLLELHGGAVPQAAVWTLFIILAAIGGEYGPRLHHRAKGMHIQTFITHRAVEALPIPVLPGAAGGDVQRGHVMSGQPPAHGQGDELRPVIAADELGRTVRRYQVREHLDHSLRWQRCGDLEGSPSRVNSSM